MTPKFYYDSIMLVWVEASRPVQQRESVALFIVTTEFRYNLPYTTLFDLLYTLFGYNIESQARYCND